MMKRSFAEKFRRQINALLENQTDAEALNNIELFEPWEPDRAYAEGERLRYEKDGEIYLYKVRDGMGHRSQSDWTPDITPALYQRLDDPSIEFPDWIMPTGAHDAYPLGAKVTHNEKHWISELNGNVYEPGVYGWDEII